MGRIVAALLLLAAVPGCNTIFGISSITPARLDATNGDGVIDSAFDGTTPDSDGCIDGHLGVRVCMPASTNLVLGSSIDTDSGCTEIVNLPNGLAAACVVSGAAIHLTSNMTMQVQGSRPLVLYASTTISIDSGSLIDVSSHHPFFAGPGADPPGCSATGAGSDSSNPADGGGGGAGGSFQGFGGNGGNSGAVLGGARGAPHALSFFQGGCPGSKGGMDSSATLGGNGGHGGGAIYLFAGGSIVVHGSIVAAGAGGNGAPSGTSGGGGGGGGAGGMIALEAPSYTVDGTLLASGGGGGGGAASTSGSDGNDPMAALPTTAAPGGAAPGNAGEGGAGSSRGTIDATTGGSSFPGGAGGGGGGGGAGYVVVYSTTQLTDVSIAPPPTYP